MTETTQPQPELTLWQRFMADTPPLFKKLQLAGIMLAGVCGAILTFIPPQILSDTMKMSIAIPGAIGTALAAISGLVVKTIAGLPANGTLEDALAALPGVIKDMMIVKAQIITTVSDAKKGEIDSPTADIHTIQQAQGIVNQAIGKVQTVTNIEDQFESAVQQKMAGLGIAK